jgi:hypothetical protein
VKNIMGQSIELLPAEERVTHYRIAASQALDCAKRTTDCELSARYVQLAAGWQGLAEEIQRSLDILNKPADLEAKPILRP